MKWTEATPAFRVNLTYFKDTGKYYSSGALLAERFLPQDLGGLKKGEVTPMFEIWAVVRFLLERRELPGLIEGHSPFTVLVEVPERPHAHPILLNPGQHEVRDLKISFTKLKE